MHDLHGKTAGRKGVEKQTDPFTLPVCDTTVVLIHQTKRLLNHVPDIGPDGLHTQQVCQDPIHSGRKFCHTIAVPARYHLGGGFTEDIGIGKDHQGSGTTERLFETLDRDGCAIGGVPSTDGAVATTM